MIDDEDGEDSVLECIEEESEGEDQDLNEDIDFLPHDKDLLG